MNEPHEYCFLCDLPIGASGEIDTLLEQSAVKSQVRLLSRLRELGFLEGAPVSMVFRAPFFGDPIGVRIRGTTIGLRVSEARLIRVKHLRRKALK